MCQYLPRRWEDALERRVSVLLLMFPRQSGVVVMSRIKTAVKNTSSINVLCGFRLKQTTGQQFSFVLCAVCGLKKKKKRGWKQFFDHNDFLPAVRSAWLPPISARLFHPHRDGVAAPSQRQLAGSLRPGDCSDNKLSHADCAALSLGEKKKNTVWFLGVSCYISMLAVCFALCTVPTWRIITPAPRWLSPGRASCLRI